MTASKIKISEILRRDIKDKISSQVSVRNAELTISVLGDTLDTFGDGLERNLTSAIIAVHGKESNLTTDDRNDMAERLGEAMATKLADKVIIPNIVNNQHGVDAALSDVKSALGGLSQEQFDKISAEEIQSALEKPKRSTRRAPTFPDDRDAEQPVARPRVQPRPPVTPRSIPSPSPSSGGWGGGKGGSSRSWGGK